MIKTFLTGFEDKTQRFVPGYVRFFAGGGGGGDGGAAAAAQQQKERETRIKNNINNIRSTIFGGPSQQTETVSESMARFGKTNEDISKRIFALENANAAMQPDPHLGMPEEFFQNQREIESLRRQGLFHYGVRTTTVPGTGPTQEDRLNKAEQTVLDFLFPKLQEQKEKADRIAKFELLRRGTAGGSAAIDTQAEIERRNDRGREQIATRGLQVKDDIKARDSRLESNLISQAQAGVEGDALIGQALANVDSNAVAAQNAARDTGVDQFFGNAGNLFSDIQLNQGFNDGQGAVAALLNKNKRAFFNNPSGSSPGTITKTF